MCFSADFGQWVYLGFSSNPEKWSCVEGYPIGNKYTDQSVQQCGLVRVFIVIFLVPLDSKTILTSR